MSDKRVLVTGASGFIGRYSLATLNALGYEVHAVYANGQSDGQATWHHADLMNAETTSRILAEVRPTHLLHFAWYAEHGKYWTSPENLRWVEASLRLLRDFAGNGGQRVVIAGTCAEYSWSHGFCSERVTPTVATTLYGTCKNALQAIATSYAHQVGISLAWGRIFFPFGPGEQAGRLVPSVIRSLLRKEVVRCSHGNQYRDFLFVQDCADAFTALLDGEVEGPVNIGSGKASTIRDVVLTLAEIVSGGKDVPIEFGAVPTPDDDPPLLVADVRRLTREVGWSPTRRLESVLAITVEAYVRSGVVQI